MTNNLLQIIILFLFHSLCLLSQNKEKTIAWSKDRPLRWEDFHRTPPSKTTNGGITATNVVLTFLDNQGSIKVQAVFFTKKSWVIPKYKSDYALKHEQIHFDIAELYARMLKRKIVEYKEFSLGNFRKKCKNIEYQLYKKRRAEQKKYDRDTNYSRNIKKQEEWNIKIAERLDELEKYSNPVIQIQFR